MSGKKSILVTFVILGAVAPVGFWTVTHAYAARKNTNSSSTTNTVSYATMEQPAATRTVDSTTLQTKIQALLNKNSDMDIGISATDLTTGQVYNYGDDNGFVAASITKLLTASLYLHETETGDKALSDAIEGNTAQHQLQQMIVNSDNNAWYALNDDLTNSALSTYAQSIGITTYDVNQNTIAPSDINLLLTKLYTNKLLNTTNTKLLLSYMSQAGETNYIVAGAGNNLLVYHKAGWLTDRMHDAAIIDDGTHAYVLVIFSKSSATYDPAAGQTLFQAVTAATNKAFLTSN